MTISVAHVVMEHRLSRANAPYERRSGRARVPCVVRARRQSGYAKYYLNDACIRLDAVELS